MKVKGKRRKVKGGKVESNENPPASCEIRVLFER
jgi:hypothetical protein